jgi:hypothetical protein
LWSWRGGQETRNFGEWFAEMLLLAMGYNVRHWDVAEGNGGILPSDACMLIVGSELHRHLVDRLLKQVRVLHVWGQGNGRGAEVAVDLSQPPYRDRVKLFGLRGPLTKRLCHVEADVPLCDPGFMMPRVELLPTGGLASGPVVYVPHHAFADAVDIQAAARAGVQRIYSPLVHRSQLDVFQCVLANSQFILSSTLHMWIWAMAYRVPCAVYTCPNERLNMPDKWRDVFESLGWEPNRSLPIVGSLAEGRRWWEAEGQFLPLPDTAAMLAAFPDPQPRVPSPEPPT